MEKRFSFASYETTEQLVLHDIPFQVKREDKVIKEIPHGAIPFHEKCEAVFFLGMVTRSHEASEWWGQYERNYDLTKRLFIGDCVGKIRVVYEDETQDFVPLIFGVNLWNYDLFEPTKEWEKGAVHPWFGPHREPFASDPEAEKLRYAANCMMENIGDTTEKGSKWIFGLKTDPTKKIEKVIFRDEPYKKAGFVVSAITGLNAGETPDPAWPILTTGYFVRREYAEAADRLARRLYQFADELPKTDPVQEISGFDAPDIRATGSNLAEIMTNVYRHNIMDMAYDKIDDTGRGHTSSKGAPYFGCYMGLGTWVPGQGSYYNDIWSRDVGRIITEVAQMGYTSRTAKSVDDLHEVMYIEASKYTVPNWKRIANVTKERDYGLWESVQCKENDGHGALMLSIYNHYWKNGESKEWVQERKEHLFDAVNWIFWQIEHPVESNFNKILYSESEATNQSYGGYDLFSNAQCIFGLLGYARMFDAVEDTALAERCRSTAKMLWEGCLEYFGQNHYRFGKTLTDITDDCWTWEYKRFAPLFLMADVFGYDVKKDAPELYALMSNSFDAEKDEYYAPEAGRQMGYGQGYLTEAAILLDRYDEMTDCINAATKFCYHHTDHPYIVPEGVILHGSKKCWFRNSDLGNAVQQGEIMKCIRLLVGVDDFNADRGLRLIPRLPDTYQDIEAKEYPISAFLGSSGHMEKADVRYERKDGGYRLTAGFSDKLKVDTVRFGPFPADHVITTHSGEQEEEYVLNGRKFVDVHFGRTVDAIDVTIA